MSNLNTLQKGNPVVKRKPRKYIPEEISFENWSLLSPFYNELEQRPINSLHDLNKWLADRSELESAVDEEMRWRYIKMTCDTNNKKAREAYEFVVTEIQPKLTIIRHHLNVKFIESPFLNDLDQELYQTMIKGIRNNIKLREDENTELLTAIELKQQGHAKIVGNMSIDHNGQTYTLPAATNFLQGTNRKTRESVYKKIVARRQQDSKELDQLFSELVQLRNEAALKVGFPNFRDYKFVELNREDYTPADCFEFHEAIKTEIIPLLNEFYTYKKEKLGIEGPLKPWDIEVDEADAQALEPFSNAAELIKKTKECFFEIRPYFAECIATMEQMNHFDLESRKGKAPGGYNMTLPEVGVPFIFMNSSGNIRDLITMVHEGGHAIHSFLSKDLPLRDFKDYPSEIAEVASMSMELISMEHWNHFFKDADDLRRSRLQLFQRVLKIFPWVAIIDKFQHWIYINPNHTEMERKAKWKEIFFEFTPSVIDYSDLEDSIDVQWQAQLHLFEVPFYYIEYAIAELGSIAMWKQYRKDPELALDNYMAMLSLGYTKPLKELYSMGGIQFNFSKKYIAELAGFIGAEMKKVM